MQNIQIFYGGSVMFLVTYLLLFLCRLYVIKEAILLFVDIKCMQPGSANFLISKKLRIEKVAITF